MLYKNYFIKIDLFLKKNMKKMNNCYNNVLKKKKKDLNNMKNVCDLGLMFLKC